MRKRKPEKEANSERWLLTYSDLVTLLMAFFIVMYASSSINTAKFAKVAASIRQGMNSGSGQSIIGNVDATSEKTSPSYIDAQSAQQQNDSTAQTAQIEQNKLAEVKKIIDKYIQQNGMTGSVGTEIQEKGLVVSFQEASFFDSGKADIKPEFSGRIVAIGSMLNTIDNYVRVEGNTDNVPIKNSQYEDNLALSSDRASNVVRLLQTESHITPARLSSTGYGENRPIADNKTEAGRAKNRRVDIVVIDSKYSATESNAGK
jgi:chemotaxis protein MotB